MWQQFSTAITANRKQSAGRLAYGRQPGALEYQIYDFRVLGDELRSFGLLAKGLKMLLANPLQGTAPTRCIGRTIFLLPTSTLTPCA